MFIDLSVHVVSVDFFPVDFIRLVSEDFNQHFGHIFYEYIFLQNGKESCCKLLIDSVFKDNVEYQVKDQFK
jgi:hypothetical protein